MYATGLLDQRLMAAMRHSDVSDAVQDYAKAIYSLARRVGEPVSTSALADRLEVSAGFRLGDGQAARVDRPGRAASPTTAWS